MDTPKKKNGGTHHERNEKQPNRRPSPPTEPNVPTESKQKKKWHFPTKKKLKRICILLVMVAVLILVLILGTYRTDFLIGKSTKLGFEDIGELVTQAAYCTQVQTTGGNRKLFGMDIPFTESKCIFSYDVILKAGVDFSEVKWKVKGSTIEVTVPPAKVLSAEIDLDSFQIYHEAESIFRKITMEDTNEALTNLEAEATQTATANGLLDLAQKNAENILTSFFSQAYDTSEYKLQFSVS